MTTPFDERTPATEAELDGTDVGFENETVRRFHDLYCQKRGETWGSTSWLGVPTVKCPLDLWIYQEMLFDVRSQPDLIVETGTMLGGTTHFLAVMFDLIGSGRLISIDNRSLERPQHPRITYLTGSSTDPDIVATVKDSIEPQERVMVILDSKHKKDHVLEELHAYAPLVTPGNYLIVEDTNLNSWRGYFEPGPLEALREFLAIEDGFEIDRTREKFMMSFNPNGYLLRTGGATGDGS